MGVSCCGHVLLWARLIVGVYCCGRDQAEAEVEAVLVCGERCSMAVGVTLQAEGITLRSAPLGAVHLAMAPPPDTCGIANLFLLTPSTPDTDGGVAALDMGVAVPSIDPAASTGGPRGLQCGTASWALVLGRGSDKPSRCLLLVPSAEGAKLVTRWVPEWQKHVPVRIRHMGTTGAPIDAAPNGSALRAPNDGLARSGPASNVLVACTTNSVAENTYSALVAAVRDTQHASEVQCTPQG